MRDMVPLAVFGFSLACLPAVSGLAQEEFGLPEEWDRIDVQAVQDAVACVAPRIVKLADENDWNVFWAQVESALQSQSLDDLGWMTASANMAYEYLNSVPEARPLADWLKQRVDYFDMAGAAIRQVPETAPAGALAPAPPAAAFQLPAAIRAAPLGVKPRPPSAPVQQQRLAAVRSEAAWKKRLKGRPLPPDAQRLVKRLKTVFGNEGTPERWVWVAEVESSLNPEARSPVGAVGLFQLMPDTAKRFHLRIFPFDDRLKPEKSARAAAEYLNILYRQFGSWSLALAAYNAGEGRVGRALKKHNAKTFEEVARHLPVETQMYVPKVMATAALREDQANGVPYAFWMP